VRLPIAHDLRSDTTLQRQAETGSDFLFRKEMLLASMLSGGRERGRERRLKSIDW